MPNVIEITDFAAPELDVYARLTQAQLRSRLEPEKGIFIAESPKVIARALDAGYQPISFLMERKQITGPASEVLARCGNAPVYTADRAMLAQLTGFELTRGVLCAMHRPLLPTVEEVCRNARRVAVLEGIVDSTNIGAIFRSAAALNMDAVLVTPSCCDPLCRRAVRVSMGTVFQVPWTQIGSTAADWPPELARKAGSLYPGGPAPVSRAALAGAIARELLALCPDFACLDEYRARCFVPGHWVTVCAAHETYAARALSIDDEGRLVIQRENGRQEALRCGEVTTRPTKTDS
jgi:tRNA G18 (ribose-2'-O)-methylase SpoU